MSEKVRQVEQMSDLELMQELRKFFGRELPRVLGWVFIASLVYKWEGGEEAAALAAKLEAQGLNRGSIYHALADVRRFGEYLENRPPVKQDHRETLRILDRLGKLTPLL